MKCYVEIWRSPSLLSLNIWKRILHSIVLLLVYWRSVLSNGVEHFWTRDCSNFRSWKCLAVILMGHLQNEPDHSKLSDSVCKAKRPQHEQPGRRKTERWVQTLDQPNQLRRCARNVIRSRISVSDRRLHGWPMALSSVLFTLWQAQRGLLLSLRFCFWHHTRKIIHAVFSHSDVECIPTT